MRARLEVLETALGTVLFTRSARGLVATDDDGRRIVDDHDALQYDYCIPGQTALSQMHGGVDWGLSHALRERTEVDPRYAGRRRHRQCSVPRDKGKRLRSIPIRIENLP